MIEDEPTQESAFLAKALEQAKEKFLQQIEEIAGEIVTCAYLPHSTEEPIITQERTWPLTCYKLEELGMWHTSGCCSSCHEDDEIEEISYPLSEYTLPDGREIRVCCKCEPWDAETEEDLELS